MLLAVSAIAARSSAVHGSPPIAAREMLAAPTAEELRYGHAVAACDGWLAVASPMLDDDAAGLGAVDLYRLAADDAGPRARLVARIAGRERFAGFGAAVAIARAEGDGLAVGGFQGEGLEVGGLEGASLEIAVGCPARDGGAGAVEVHLVRQDGVVVAQPPPVPRSAEQGCEFGATLALDAKWLVVGAPRASVGGRFDAGRVSVFTRGESPPRGWIHAYDISAPEASESAQFGAALSLHDGVLAVGAPRARVVGPEGDELASAGEVAVYRLGRTGAAHLATLRAPKPARWARFGSSIAGDGPLLAVGADGDECGGVRTGAVHVFDVSRAAAPRHLRRLAPPAESRTVGMGFGAAVAMQGPLLLAGAPGTDRWIGPDSSLATTEDSGTAWLLDSLAGAVLAELAAPEPLDMGLYGSAVALGATAGGASAAFVGHRFVAEEATGTHAGVGVYGR